MSTFLTSYLFLVMTFTPSMNQEFVDNYNAKTSTYLEDNLDLCITRADSAIKISQDLGYIFGEGNALYLKGYAYVDKSNLGKAFITYLKALEILENLDSERAIETKIKLNIEVGLLLRKHFKYDQSIQYYDQGLYLAESEGFEKWLLDLHYNKGFALHEMGRLEEAIASLQKAYKLGVAASDEYIIINSLNLIGLIYEDDGQFDQARMYFQQMLDHSYQSLNQNKYHGRAYHNMASTYKNEGDLVNAELFYEKALAEKKIYDRAKDLFITQMDLASLYQETDRIEEAFALASEAMINYEKLSLDPEYYKIHELMKQICFARKDYAQAEHYSDQYFAENNRFLTQQQELIKIRDQFKMEMLSASYFSGLERERRIADLYNYILYGLLGLLTILVLNRVVVFWRKKMLEKDLRKVFEDISDLEKLL